MYKIAITGKANSGKNTLGKLLSEEINNQCIEKFLCGSDTYYIAFADPIKKMISLMFPSLPKEYLYGPSSYRNEKIPNAFKDGQPLTVRQLLMDLGTGIGRTYNTKIWLDAFDVAYEQAKAYSSALDEEEQHDSIIVTDVRFRNEFDHLKELNFYQIKLLRESHTKINHASEINQDSIKDNEFDYIVYNNGTLDDLKKEVAKIVANIV